MVSALAKVTTPRGPGYDPYTDPLLALLIRLTVNRKHDRYISFTLCRGCTLYPQFVSPDLPEIASLLNTSFGEWLGIHYEAFIKTYRKLDSPLEFQ